MTYSERILEYMQGEGLTQSQFAARVGVTQAAINRYANDERLPRRETALAISAATNGAVPFDAWLEQVAQPRPVAA